MNATVTATALRQRRLDALGVARLHLRGASVARGDVTMAQTVPDPVLPVMPAASTGAASVAPASVVPIRRLALQADATERNDPAIDKMYMDLTEAVSKAGLQPVRVCDVAADATAAVMIFGNAAVPADVPAMRVLRADPLVILHGDRARKRQLWDRLLALGRAGSS